MSARCPNCGYVFVPVVTRRQVSELRWLADKTQPVWGGTIDDDGKILDADICRYIELGLVKQVNDPRKGFVITDAGIAAAEGDA